jgi:GGDEF domain-containing protein
MVFSHDGLRDSLTFLAAPPLFYENLRRDLAASSRNKTHLSLVQFHMLPAIHESEINESNINESHTNEDLSIYELAIINFSQILKSESRSEDLCARLGRFEFTLIIKANIEVALKIANRVQKSWCDPNFRCVASVVAAKINESALEVLNRLDTAARR